MNWIATEASYRGRSTDIVVVTYRHIYDVLEGYWLFFTAIKFFTTFCQRSHGFGSLMYLENELYASLHEQSSRFSGQDLHRLSTFLWLLRWDAGTAMITNLIIWVFWTIVVNDRPQSDTFSLYWWSVRTVVFGLFFIYFFDCVIVSKYDFQTTSFRL